MGDCKTGDSTGLISDVESIGNAISWLETNWIIVFGIILLIIVIIAVIVI